jgi:hypothetical protein
MQQPLSELIRFRAPEGFQAAVASTAEREGLSLSAYLRRLALLDIESRREAQRRKAELAMHDGPAGLIAA